MLKITSELVKIKTKFNSVIEENKMRLQEIATLKIEKSVQNSISNKTLAAAVTGKIQKQIVLNPKEKLEKVKGDIVTKVNSVNGISLSIAKQSKIGSVVLRCRGGEEQLK